MLPPRPNGYAEVVATFGNPLDYLNFKAGWEREALVSLHLPRPLLYAYDRSRRVSVVRAHRLIAQHLVDTLMACLDAGVPVERMAYGGTYCWRAQRGAAVFSMHTFWIAIDIQTGAKPMGKAWVDDGSMF